MQRTARWSRRATPIAAPAVMSGTSGGAHAGSGRGVRRTRRTHRRRRRTTAVRTRDRRPGRARPAGARAARRSARRARSRRARPTIAVRIPGPSRHRPASRTSRLDRPSMGRRRPARDREARGDPRRHHHHRGAHEQRRPWCRRGARSSPPSAGPATNAADSSPAASALVRSRRAWARCGEPPASAPGTSACRPRRERRGATPTPTPETRAPSAIHSASDQGTTCEAGGCEHGPRLVPAGERTGDGRAQQVRRQSDRGDRRQPARSRRLDVRVRRRRARTELPGRCCRARTSSSMPRRRCPSVPGPVVERRPVDVGEARGDEASVERHQPGPLPADGSSDVRVHAASSLCVAASLRHPARPTRRPSGYRRSGRSEIFWRFLGFLGSGLHLDRTYVR